MKNSDNENRSVLDFLTSQLSQEPTFASVWLVGSMSRAYSNAAGIDLLVACRHNNFNGNVKKATSALSRHQVQISDDSVLLKIGDINVGVALHYKPTLLRRVRQYCAGRCLDGMHRPWAAGYWLPEALCADLESSTVLHDLDDDAMRITRSLSPYPERMAHAIEILCRAEISQKSAAFRKNTQLYREMEAKICLHDISMVLIRLAFARSRRYLRGFHRLSEQRQGLPQNENRLITAGEELMTTPTEETLKEIEQFL